MSSSLADYLAKNYLSADPPPDRPKKKRKKTKNADAGGLIIADDDPPDLRSSANKLENEDEDGPVIDSSRTTAEFRRAKKSNWKVVGGPTPAASTQTYDI